MINIGIILIVVAAVLFILEVVIPGFFIGVVATAFGLAGIVALIFGDEVLASGWIALILIVGVGLGMVVSILFYKKIGKITPPTTTTGESLIGKVGIVTRDTDPEIPTKGKVRLGSEIWSAEADTVIEKGTRIVVIDCIGVHVKIEKFEDKRKVKRK